MTKLEQIIKEDLPAMLALLKEKFAAKSIFKTFKSDNGDLSYEGELAIGTEIFAQHNPEQEACIMKEKKAGKTKEEAEKMCMGVGKMEHTPAGEKTYKHQDGTEITVKEGKVIDVKKPSPPALEKNDMKAMVEELFKTFPKTDLSAIETSLAELKTTLASIQTERADLKAKVDKFDSFKTEVIGILDKFSKTASATPSAPKKTDSSKSIFNNALTMDERIKLLQETKI